MRRAIRVTVTIWTATALTCVAASGVAFAQDAARWRRSARKVALDAAHEAAARP